MLFQKSPPLDLKCHIRSHQPNFGELNSEKTPSLQFMPLISMRRDSEQVLLRFFWTPAPHRTPPAWMTRGAAALPSTPRAGWLPRLHSKVTQLGFVPASIRLWVTDCAPRFEQMWFLAFSELQILPSACNVHNHKFKESHQRKKTHNYPNSLSNLNIYIQVTV